MTSSAEGGLSASSIIRLQTTTEPSADKALSCRPIGLLVGYRRR
jgi:hypothetical protein